MSGTARVVKLHWLPVKRGPGRAALIIMIDSESEGNAVASRPAAAQCQWHSGLQPSESNLNPV